MYGNLGEAEILLNKAITIEPREHQHITDLRNLKGLIELNDELHKYFEKKEFEKVEEIAHKLLEKCPEYSHCKIWYLEALLENLKINQVVSFISTKLNDEEKNNDEFDYLLALAFYYDGK